MERNYSTQQTCPIARTLDIIGERWTLLVLRDLSRGHGRFQDLLGTLEGISPNVLSDRLKRLEAAGIVERTFYSEHPPRAEYSLTEKGWALRPALDELREWGERYVPVAP